MTPMDHAAAHERIEDLLLEPARLAVLPGSTDPDDVALRDHLAGCPTCSAELEAWRRMQTAVGDAVSGDAAAARASVEPIAPPASLREQVLRAARPAPSASTAAADPAEAPVSIVRVRAERQRRFASWVSLAAAAIILAGSAVITVDQVNRRAAAESAANELNAALAVVDRMLATDHKVVQLTTTTGATAGTISWSRHDWVVLTNALPEPPAGQEYLCWLETDGRSVKVGRMDFAGGTAYWVASLDEWQTWELGPTTQFVVTLEQAGAAQRTGQPILEARLSS